MDTQTLVEALTLERLEVNLFRGTTPAEEAKRERIYGGQVIAQSLLAAYQTVEDRLCHSLHCYFIRPGDPSIPIIFEVDRSRDGGSFTTRRVIAVQHGQQIFNLAASFQVLEEGFEHQSEMPDAPAIEDVQDDVEARRAFLDRAPPEMRESMERPQPIEMRTVGGRMDLKPVPREPRQQLWFRARDPIGADQHMHQVMLAYASDMSLLGTSIRPHGVSWNTPGFQSASLDHAMWFHQPTDFNEWHLYHQESPSASGGRGFNLGYIYRASDGALVATCAQEGLMRMRKPKPKG
ncbi:MAG: acyl-CoA thioesterase II [Alphaproteobacteria bacterium]|nr:acyl-CoA thioesterase II [Alphaproteobacteria bacterium]MBU1514893.1 acyl-CoA thioesterase II [Alphaproteobacteria bacterium]MBU2093814.1 acyl-CoA thioesterase II [Alphaproteobacteria bacterium]MBU2149435.1 acyl-CoA thioesterase II [Alphaproteobacteria bacterium]MBU2305395.1 acyl-CoA thioesterase II [Alphaproteobacteria bacterium]